MRVALVFQWLRAARQDPARARACRSYVTWVSLAQIGWIAQMFLDFSIGVSLILSGLLILVEMVGPIMAERKDGGTPWHAHHIAERYGLFAIIALGEGVVGTVAALSAIVEQQGWTLDTALVGIAGTGLTFGMWWIYFSIPWAEVLARHRDRAWAWGYLQIALFGSLVGVGAGLHVAAYVIGGEAHVDATFAALTIAIPVLAFETLLFVLYALLVMQFDLFHRQIEEGDVAAAIEEFAPLTAHYQIASPPDRGEPDDGEMNYAFLLKLIDRTGFTGWIGCEYRPRRGTVEGLAWVKACGVSLG